MMVAEAVALARGAALRIAQCDDAALEPALGVDRARPEVLLLGQPLCHCGLVIHKLIYQTVNTGNQES